MQSAPRLHARTCRAGAWGGGPFGIDHRWSYDNSVWNRGAQRAIEYSTIAVALAGARWRAARRLGRTYWQALDAGALSLGTGEVAKRVFSRERPIEANDPDKWFQGGGHRSFPSSEVSTVAGIVTPFVLEYGREVPAVWALEATPAMVAIGRHESASALAERCARRLGARQRGGLLHASPRCSGCPCRHAARYRRRDQEPVLNCAGRSRRRDALVLVVIAVVPPLLFADARLDTARRARFYSGPARRALAAWRRVLGGLGALALGVARKRNDLRSQSIFLVLSVALGIGAHQTRRVERAPVFSETRSSFQIIASASSVFLKPAGVYVAGVNRRSGSAPASSAPAAGAAVDLRLDAPS